MASQTSIEWTEMTWNPVTGCVKVSQGCKNCYAERMAKRLTAMRSHRYINGFQPTLHPDLVDAPRKWKAPRTVFVNSMSDLFQPIVPEDFIQAVFRTMRECPQHTFQILTKRGDRLARVAPRLHWSPNIWMGVSVESEKVLSRVDALRKTRAAVKFLSCEPLLGPLPNLNLTAIDWVIVGGESGPKARSMKGEWARQIRDVCEQTETAFFFKQWGGVRKDRTGRELDGRLWNDYPLRRIIPISLAA